MSRNILGIDIGSSSVKVARLNTSLKANTITHLSKKNYDPGDSPEAFIQNVRSVIKELLVDEIKSNDEVVISISSNLSIERKLTVPLRDLKKITGIVKFTLEPDIIFNIDDLIVDFIMIKRGTRAEKASEIIAVGVEKKRIDEHLSILKELNIEPRTINVDSFALWTSYESAREDTKKRPLNHDIFLEAPYPIALVDIGAGKTSISIIDEEKLIFTRSVKKAGNFITETLAREMGLTFENAEKTKIELSESERESTKINQGIYKSIENAVAAICKEIEITFFSFYSKSQGGKEIKELILTGGSSQVKYLAVKCKEKFKKIKISYYDISHGFSESGIDTSEKDGLYYPTAIGLCLNGSGKGDFINLRKEEFVSENYYNEFKKDIIFISAQLIIIGIIFLSGLFYQLKTKEIKYTTLKSRRKAIFVKALPDIKKVKAGNEVKILRNKIEANEKKLGAFGGAAETSLSSLALMREVSAYIPQSIKIDVTEMTISQKKIRLRGMIESFDALDILQKNLEKSKYFTKFKVEDAKKAKGDDKKDIEFRGSVLLEEG